MTFQLNEADWKAFLRAIKSSPFWKVMRRAPWVLLLQAVLVAADQDFQSGFAVLGWAVLVIAVPYFLLTLGVVAGVGVYAVLKQQWSFHKTPSLQGPMTITADDEGLSTRTSRALGKYFWTSLHKIIETETHFFVLQTPGTGFIIPKRAFGSPFECAQFGAFIKQKWVQRRAQSAPIAPAKSWRLTRKFLVLN